MSLRAVVVLTSLLPVIAACARHSEPTQAPLATVETPRSQVRSIQPGWSTDQVHRYVSGIARPYDHGVRSIVMPSLRPLVHRNHDEADPIRVEWYRVKSASRCFTWDYDHHLLEPVVYRDHFVLGAGWPFLEASYRSLGFTERDYQSWLVVGFAICDR